jgi:hypothetical protein
MLGLMQKVLKKSNHEPVDAQPKAKAKTQAKGKAKALATACPYLTRKTVQAIGNEKIASQIRDLR